MPTIIVSEIPAELIISQGDPEFFPIEGTNLTYMSNTENDVVLDSATQFYYVLLSGRWYRSFHLEGPWSYVRPEELPADFTKIPANSALGNVLTGVPGTPQAQEAVDESEIPQTASVARKDAQLEVAYDGPAEFEPIQGTDMKYAVNTSTPVILAQGRYWACSDAVWFDAPTPGGPWEAADHVPGEIQNIPPDNPDYNVKYVYILASTLQTIYTGYTSGYLGSYVYGGTVVYGTGYFYRAWYRHYYYAYPRTWGFHAYYAPGGWNVGDVWSASFYNVGEAWNQGWHSQGWYGPNGYYGVRARDINSMYQDAPVNYHAPGFGGQIHVGNFHYTTPQNPMPGLYQQMENSKWITPSPPKAQISAKPFIGNGRAVALRQVGAGPRNAQSTGKSSPNPSGAIDRGGGARIGEIGNRKIGAYGAGTSRTLPANPANEGGLQPKTGGIQRSTGSNQNQGGTQRIEPQSPSVNRTSPKSGGGTSSHSGTTQHTYAPAPAPSSPPMKTKK